jgi:iron complex outermembrane receptor protein
MHCRPLVAAAAFVVSQTPAAEAQTVSSGVAPVLETVLITGSRLRRTDAETPSPVQVITREEIARSGAVGLNEVLQKLPANNTGAINEADAINNYGAAAVSLRGLGPGSTLVLVNGRRVAPFGFTGRATFVDLNQIPVSAIDRIEVLLDGASAIYGSDAIAGVVNVILRREVRGIEVAGGLGRSSHGDADERTASATFGIGDRAVDGYNVFASVSHADQDAVKASERWHSQSGDYRGFGLIDARSPASYPGNLYSADNRSFLQPLAPCATIGDAASANPGRCVSDPSLAKDIVVRSRRDALFAAGSAALGAGFELFGDVALARTVFAGQAPSFTTSTYFNQNTLAAPFIPLRVGHPQNPYPVEVALRTRFADQPLVVTPTSDTQRAVVGLRRSDWDGWDVESALLWSRSSTRVTTTGVIHDAVLTGEVLDTNGRAVPTFRFGDPGANDPALMARLYPALVDTGRTSTTSLDVRGSREVFRLPAGPAQLAVGAEVRRERYESAFDPLTAGGEISVIFGTSATGSRTVGSAYAELALPITSTLEASLAARWDRYSDFGSTTNPKAGLKWKVSPGIALRATYATAFRAPSLSETSQGATPGFATVRDPMTCPVPDPANPNCTISVPATSTGNPALKPERARSATAGIVVEPWRDASFTVDAFRIERRDQIDFIDPAFLLDNESSYPGYVVRKADGTIDHLNLQYTNLGETRVWGIDVSARAKTLIDGVGRFGIDGSYEWLPHYWTAQTTAAPSLDYAGSYEQPKSRARIALTFERGPWRSALTFHYTGGYLRAFSPSDLGCPYAGGDHPELCSVTSWSTWDLFLGYAPLPNLELGLVVNNVGNVQAPFDERKTLGAFTTYDPALHSAVGRFFRLTAKYSFR